MLQRHKPLPRSTKPLKRTGRIKAKPVARAVLQLRQDWAAEHEGCAACWSMPGEWNAFPKETHHIIKRSQGSKTRDVEHVANYLRLCMQCHKLAEGESVPHDAGGHWPKLSLGMCLTLKLESDPGCFDLAELRRIRGRVLPELEPVPEVFLAERRKRFGVEGYACS